MKKGTLFGLSSGLLWGLATVILGIVLATSQFIQLGNNASLVATMGNDTISFIILLSIVLITSKFNSLFKVLKSRSGLIIIAASIFAAPIGMTGYVLSIKYLNPSIAASLSAIYPLVGILLAFIILKEKTKLRALIGVLISVSAIVLMGLSNYSSITNFFLGLLFSSVCIIGWGAEAVIIGYALKDEVDPIVALTLRQMTSSVVYLLVVLPIIGYSSITTIFASSNTLIIIIFAAIAGTMSYILYYRAIDLLGASKAMALNISYPAWAFVFTVILIGGFSVVSFLLSLVIIIGTLLSVDDISEILPFIKKKT